MSEIVSESNSLVRSAHWLCWPYTRAVAAGRVFGGPVHKWRHRNCYRVKCSGQWRS